MKTIQIKVTIDGVNYFSEIYNTQYREYIDNEVENKIDNGLPIGFTDDKGNKIYFGSDLVKKSIITIIEH